MNVIRCPPRDLLRLGVVHADGLVGYVDLHGDAAACRELGFVIRPTSQGRGNGTAAATAALRFGFDILGLERIWAESWATNTRSLRILTRIGMRPTGAGAAGEYLGERTHYERFDIIRPEMPSH